ncbi:GntR family transcriptional regulator / MocR family aminotransferase [Tistlia consotensis]|uniref:GntR family transcriptional regulator / MocR family aminotransferase n=1 Tax=Tistlia consotensis USBA 355 TaxID=560819 RepID=A0A1Y6CDE6_9PROT|nr:PLP-dependent aminotransferase family protein [Tistlia consotensis]SMF48602.1 GntR family transcriptional regulator / MocR family aminotransferase [Tistlia consotensis USBA 355]SNR80982.1 GntR family transcriptional regulator / MocR family aminotransferase [Tistlia consotensis]
MLLLRLDSAAGRPLQEQVAAQLSEQIASGRLRPGERLPPTRVLARELGLSRNTVALAYDRLMAEGYIEGRRGAGTFVCDSLPEQSLRAEDPQGSPAEAARVPPPRFHGRQHVLVHRQEAPIDFWVQRADPRLFPLKTWRRLVAECLARPGAGANLTEYSEPAGLLTLRQAIADEVAASRGIAVEPEQVFVVAGAQLALNLVTRLYLRGGETVVVEDPCNQGAGYLFEALDCRLLPVPLDAEGLRTDLLPEAAGALLYTTPSHQYPLGTTLSLDRRRVLLDWAERNGALIIEDDYDSHFVYEGPPEPSLKALRGDLVVHLGTFSKSLGAGIRMGYAIVPPALVDKTTAAKALLDNGPPWLEQAALARFLAEGGYRRHVRRLRQTCLDRRDALLAALERHFGRVALTGTRCGTHVVWHLPEDFPEATAVARAARARQVGVYTLESGGGHEYGTAGIGRRALMIGFAAVDERQIDRGIALLAAAIDGLHRPGG